MGARGTSSIVDVTFGTEAWIDALMLTCLTNGLDVHIQFSKVSMILHTDTNSANVIIPIAGAWCTSLHSVSATSQDGVAHLAEELQS